VFLFSSQSFMEVPKSLMTKKKQKQKQKQKKRKENEQISSDLSKAHQLKQTSCIKLIKVFFFAI